MSSIIRLVDPESQHPSSLCVSSDGHSWLFFSRLPVWLQSQQVAPLVSFQNPETDVFLYCYPHALSLVAFLSEGSTHPSSQWWVPSNDPRQTVCFRKVWTASGGNCTLFLRSTLICHDSVACRWPFLVFLEDGGFFPSLMNWMERVVHTWAWERGGPFCAARMCSSYEDGWTNTAYKFYQLTRDQ